MSTEVVLSKKLLFCFAVVLFLEIPDPVSVALQAHVFGEVSELSSFCVEFAGIRDKNPGKDWVLCDIGIASTCNLIEPLKVLIIGEVLIDPLNWPMRVEVVAEGILFDLDD